MAHLLPLGIGMESLDPLSDPTLVHWVLVPPGARNARPHVARVCSQFQEDEGIDTI